jgi:Domain of unknown function (DUF4292)
MHLIKYVFIGFLLLAACKPVKKMQTINEAITKKDTAQSIIIVNQPTIDSAALKAGILKKITSQEVKYNTFSAKARVLYEGFENNLTVTAYIKLIKDSVLNIRINYPPFGLVLEALIKPDSVILYNKKDKYVQYRSIAYLQEITQIPFNFSTLQNLIVGNPIFVSNNIVSYKVVDNQLLALMIGDIFKHLITVDNTNLTLQHSKLDDVDVQRNRTCDITLSNYENKMGQWFSTYRLISVAEKTKLDVTIDFKQYAFNEPVNIEFFVPKNYPRK